MPKSFLITGAAGSIGSELVRQHAENGDKVMMFDNNEPIVYDLWEKLKQEGYDVYVTVGDVRNPEDLEMAYRNCPRGTLTYHVAAQKVVTAMEWFPQQSIDVNIQGTMNVLNLARNYSSKVVFISTDKAAKADCVMGASKRLMEIIVRNSKGIVVRFGNVMNSRGSVIPLWKKQIEEGKPLTITDRRCKRFLMTIPDAVGLVRKAGEEAKQGETWIMDMGEPVSILRLAQRVLKECNQPKDYPTVEIGLRDGEVFEELLMTRDEIDRAVKKENFYVIS